MHNLVERVRPELSLCSPEWLVNFELSGRLCSCKEGQAARRVSVLSLALPNKPYVCKAVTVVLI